MPTIGLPEFVVAGPKGYDPSFSEAYFAATSLGMKAWLFQALTFGTCGILVVLSMTRLVILNTDIVVPRPKEEEYMYEFGSMTTTKQQSALTRFMNNYVRKYIVLICLAFIMLVFVVDVFAVGFGTHPTIPTN